MLTETWLTESIYDSELFDSRYQVFRRDRASSLLNNKDRGGGVLIAVSNKYDAIRVSESESLIEDLWIKIKMVINCNTVCLNVCCVYIPCPPTMFYLDHFLTKLNKVMDGHTKSNILILGDFNLSQVTWQGTSEDGALSPDNFGSPLGSLLVDTLSFNNLNQFNSNHNSHGKILDLVLSNLDSIRVIRCSDPLTKEDLYHPALLVKTYLTVAPSLPIYSKLRSNFFKADYHLINQEINKIPWSATLGSEHSVSDMTTVFYSKINSIINKNVPLNKHNVNTFPVWYSKSLIKLINEKNKCHKTFKKFKNPRDKLTHSLLRTRCKQEIKAAFKRYTVLIEKNISKNPKLFWNYVKNSKRKLGSIPQKMYHENKFETDGVSIANLFSSYFDSIYTSDTLTALSTDQSTPNPLHHTICNLFRITQAETVRALQTLNIYKGAGPDDIPPLFLNKCAFSLGEPLTILFNESLIAGVFPDIWKRSHVIPIFKNGAVNNVSNYRPISILSSIPKVFESLIHKQILQHVHRSLSTHQHGFLPKRSTLSNLALYVNNLTEIVDAGSQVHAIYTDFSKAFDVVNHRKLVEKMEMIGVPGILINWIKSYLINRQQVVVLNGYKSVARTVPSGVPQGSHLGPLLFLIFINDIGTVINHCNYLLFADDLKLFKETKSVDDCKLIQEDLTNITRWCESNGMQLNPTKCFHINFTKRTKHKVNHIYKIRNSDLAQVTEIKDLGITIDSKLQFKSHIHNTVKSASKMLGFTLRTTKHFTKQSTKLLLYNTYVRSRLEYCCPAWNPTYITYINQIEKIQRRFLYHLSFKDHICGILQTYESRLKHYNIPTLANRRTQLDLRFLFKITTGLIDCPNLLNKIRFNVPRLNARVNNFAPFDCTHYRTNLGFSSVVPRICRTFNKYHMQLDIASSFANFRSSCDELFVINESDV